MNSKILEISNLRTEFIINKRRLVAIRDVSLHVDEMEIVGIVGESGCGKSLTAYSVLDIVPSPGRVVSGDIVYRDENFRKKSKSELRRIRGKEVSLVFQDPLSSLNPVYNIFWHFKEVYRAHNIKKSMKEKKEEVIQVLKSVAIPDPEKKIYNFPHQFSGGMRQRVVIALALILNPKLLIADEPTTALDVTTQRAIFDLLNNMRNRLGLSIILISHDLFLIAEQCDRIYVMYSGEIMESGSSEDILHRPKHPYSIGLINSIPTFNSDKKMLSVVKGELRSGFDKGEAGCCFADRCFMVGEECLATKPPLKAVDNQLVRCLKV